MGNQIADYLRPWHATYMAAVMAHSNLGFGLPDREAARPQLCREFDTMSVETAVQWVLGYRAEGQEHMDIFTDEASGWVETCRDATVLQEKHPTAWEWYKNVLAQRRWRHAKAAMNGASNQRLLARVLHEAIIEVQEECGDLKDDAAVRMIQHQLGHLLGVEHIMDLTLYSRFSKEVNEKAPD